MATINTDRNPATDVGDHLLTCMACNGHGGTCTRIAEEREPIEITDAAGLNVMNLIKIATQRAEAALERGDRRAANRALESIRKYAMNAQRAR